MNFYVNGIEGGNAEVGTVSSSGLYTAPAVVPNPYTVQITSQIAKYPERGPGSVSVQVWNPIPVMNAVNPGGFSEGVTDRYGERIAVCLWRSDQLEWRDGSDNLCFRHPTGSRNLPRPPRALIRCW